MLNKIIETLHASAELLNEDELSSLKNKLLNKHWDFELQEIQKQHKINCELINKEFNNIMDSLKKESK